MGWFSHDKLGVVLMCADWRLHHPRVDIYRNLCRTLRVARIDVASVPGPDGLLKPEREAEWEIIHRWIKFYTEVHDAVKIGVVGHQQCAAHPVDNDQHEHDVLETAVALKERTGFEGGVMAIIATHETDKKWGLTALGEY